jgi:HEAT repeat protein
LCGRIGPKAGDAVPDLLEALEDKDESMRRDAVDALGRIGAMTKAVIPGLIAALQDESADVRREAAYALGEVGLAQAHLP